MGAKQTKLTHSETLKDIVDAINERKGTNHSPDQIHHYPLWFIFGHASEQAAIDHMREWAYRRRAATI